MKLMAILEGSCRPTDEMILNFEKRTREHINRVKKYLNILYQLTDLGKELLVRADNHDLSKYGPIERLPYIWITEFHRCKNAGINFRYPDCIKDKINVATKHHITTNRHHPEYFSDISDMNKIDIAEMVADWAAMAEELNEGSPRAWANKMIGVRWHFTNDQIDLIYAYIDLIE